MPYLRLQWVLSIRNFNPVSASFIEPVYKNMPRLICVIFSYDTQQCRLCYTQSTQLSIQSSIQESFANSNKQHFSTPSSILNAFNNHNVRQHHPGPHQGHPGGDMGQ
jgi:hypothetical protein